MQEIPFSERPYERCQAFGPDQLTDAELLSVIIRTGTNNRRAVEVAMDVLNSHRQHKGLIGLHYLSFQDLKKIPGVGRVKAIQLLCVAELARRMAKCSREQDEIFMCPGDIAKYFMEDMRHRTTECVIVLLLDAKNQRIHHQTITTGTINSSLSPAREILKYALEYDAVNFVLLHNHPSGDPTPSQEDINMTKRLCEAGKLLGIPLMDHIVIGDNVYVSLREHGIFS